MLDSLTQRLTKVVKTIRGQARLTESNMQDMLREIRIALLEADVAIPVVKDLIARIKEKALGTEVQTSLTPGQALVGIVHDELTKVIGGEDPENVREINLATQPPAIILLAGLQGAGKTTTAGKLGKWLKEEKKKKVLTVSADVYLPLLISYKQFLSRPTLTSSRVLRTKNRSILPARPSNTQSFITTTCSSSIRPVA